MSGEQEQVDLDFGRRVRLFRLRKGLSQQLLADRVGISQSKLSDSETGVGVVQFTPSQILALARELDVEPLELLGLPIATGIRAEGPIAEFLLTARDLTDSDIEALTITARQLASARGEARTALRRVAEGGAAYTVEDERLIERLTAYGVERTRAEQAVRSLGTPARGEPRSAPAARPAGRRRGA